MATHGRKAQVLMASGAGISMTNETMTDAGDHQNYTIANAAKRYWDSTASFVVQQANDELQSVTITGTPTGGTFVLRFGGQDTSLLNWNCTASQMQTALQALSSIGANNALVTGGPGPGTAFQVQFTAALGQAVQSLITLQTNSLTGGSSPNVSIAEVKAGQAFTTITTGFALQYVGGKVIYTIAQVVGTYVRISSGKYRVYAAIAGAKAWGYDVEREEKENTEMTTNSTPTIWRTFRMGLLSGTFKLGAWFADSTYFDLISQDISLIISLVFDASTSLPRIEAEVLMKKDSIAVMLSDLDTEDLEFRINGPVYLVTT